MRRAFGKTFLLLSALFLIPATYSHAQDSGSVTGVVSDQTGAVLVGAEVTLENVNAATVFHATTNSVGSYTIPNVPAGSGYKMTFNHAGFGPVEYSDIYLSVAGTRTQNARLTPSTVSTTLEVSAAGQEVTLNTADATIGNNLDVRLLQDLPIQARDTPGVLFSLQPGVVTVPVGTTTGSAVTGARTDQTTVTLDGLDVNDITTGQTFEIVGKAPVDSVEQFRGTVAGLLSSAGPGGGGQYQLITKSGSDQWHGNINEYHRDSSTAANDWFGNLAGLHRAHLVRNQFGGNIGGPILRDKAFFFFNYYGFRQASSATTLTIVPLDSYRNGNIQYILAQASNGSGPCGGASRANTTPQCIGTLTPAQIAQLDPLHIGFSPTLLPFLNSRYPHANDLTAGDGLNTGGYRFNAPKPDTRNNYVVRVDYTLSPSMKVFAKAGIQRRDAVQTPQYLPNDPILSNPFYDRSYTYVVGHTWQIGSNKVNEFYYGDTVEKFNFPAANSPTGGTALTFGGGSTFFLGSPYNDQNRQESQKRRIPIPMVRDDFNWTKGTHNLAFGGSFKFIKTESQQIFDFNFVSLGLGTGLPGLDASVRPVDIRTAGTVASSTYDNAFAFALGHLAGVSTNFNYDTSGAALPSGTGHVRRYRYYQTELYAADTWKLNRGLSVAYGLRYQFYSVPYETQGAESVQNFTFDKYMAARVAQSAAGISGDTAVPFITYTKGGKANNGPSMFQPNYKDFSPRVSFAYNPTWFPKMVVRGGAGIVFDRTVLNALNFAQDQSSILFQNSATTNYGAATAAASLSGDPRIGANFSFINPNTPGFSATPNVVGGSPVGLINDQFNTIIDPNLKDPYSIALNFGIEHELPGNMVLSVDYAGRLGRRLLAQADASQLVDFPDKTSGQLLSDAFANLTLEMRAGQATATPQPWFENQVGPGWTQRLYRSFLGGLIYNGDMSDFVQALAYYRFIDSNIGMASQFAENTFYTNKGFSNYHGMLVSVRKNMSHGLQFDVNYTWSHSIDNTSLIANQYASAGIGFICDVLRPRECRGNSDFDMTHVINSDFTYQLPIGRNRTWFATAPRWADQLIGGWNISGIPAWHSGQAFTTGANAYLAGFAETAPAIFNGDRGALRTNIHKNPDGTVQLFADQTAALSAFSGPVGLQVGSRNNLRGPSAFTMDAGLAKTFNLIPERLNLQFRADAFNVFNHPTFGLPSNDITSPQFGQITQVASGSAPRVVQLAVRLEF